MSNQKNQGEGDKQSAKRFNKQQQEFVESAEGQKKIDAADEIEITDDMREAERKSREAAKEEDPAVKQ